MAAVHARIATYRFLCYPVIYSENGFIYLVFFTIVALATKLEAWYCEEVVGDHLSFDNVEYRWGLHDPSGLSFMNGFSAHMDSRDDIPIEGGTMQDRVKGTVKWFSRVKGFGFIGPDVA